MEVTTKNILDSEPTPEISKARQIAQEANEKDGEESPSGKLVVGNTPGGGDSQKEGEEAHASNHDGGFTESGAEQSRANVFP